MSDMLKSQEILSSLTYVNKMQVMLLIPSTISGEVCRRTPAIIIDHITKANTRVSILTSLTGTMTGDNLLHPPPTPAHVSMCT